MKKTNITKKIAAMLAAVMIMTTAASIAASANNTDAANTTTVTQNEKQLEKARDLGIDMIFTGIEEFVPGGKLLTPVLKLFSNELLGKGDELSLDDINARIDDMFSKLDDLNDDLRDSIENITAVQDFDSFHFKTYNSQIHEIISQIEVIRTLDITDENKLARIAALVNNSSCWTESNNVFITFSNLTQALNRASLTKKGDIFTILYQHYAKTSMFSGEAIDKASAAADLIITDYMAGYYALMQCLSAQSIVCNMTAEQKKTIDPYYLNKVTDQQALITKKVNELKEAALGNTSVRTERYIKGYKDVVLTSTFTTMNNLPPEIRKMPVYAVREVVDYDASSVIGKYNTFKNTDRMLFINKGTTSIKVSPFLTTTSHNAVPVYASCTDGSGRSGPVYKSTRYFNENIAPRMYLNADNVKAIAAFISGKGITMRQYLKNNGFCVDDIPTNANFLTSQAYHDANNAKHICTALGGSVQYHTFYKGINIDEVNPTEKETAFYHTGCNYYGIEEWNYVAGGNVVTFNTNAPTTITGSVHTQYNGFIL